MSRDLEGNSPAFASTSRWLARASHLVKYRTTPPGRAAIALDSSLLISFASQRKGILACGFESIPPSRGTMQRSDQYHAIFGLATRAVLPFFLAFTSSESSAIITNPSERIRRIKPPVVIFV
jgi:hypothetical protein